MGWMERLVRRRDVQLLDPAAPPARVDEHAPHAVVIGAGFGGLAAAVRLSVRGFRVTMIERLGQPGGRARVFHQEGFNFDAGPTVITAPFLFDELWQLCGRRREDDVGLRPLSPFYRIRFEDGSTFDYSGDGTAMRQEVARFSADDVEGYEQFVAKSREIFRVGFEELGHVPFDRVYDMLRIVPAMARLGSHRSVYELVSQYIDDDKLRRVLSFHPLLVGGNPFSTTSIYALIAYLERKWGVHYVMGGTGKLVQGLVDLLKERGVRLRLGEEVTSIQLEDGRAAGVQLASGEEVAADLVVSNADVVWTYRNLLPRSVRSRWTDWRLEHAKHSMSLFVWYFGTERRYEGVAHHTILMGTRYEELLEDIFSNHVLAEDFSLYLHRPTATDPSIAPIGHDAFYVLSPVPHLESGVVWDEERTERYRQDIAHYLSSTILPGLNEAVVTSRTLTPQDFRDDYLATKGAAFSLEPTLVQSAYFRPHNRSAEVDHLYFVGAGTHPGAGLPGVLSSARVLDTVVPAPDTFGSGRTS